MENSRTYNRGIKQTDRFMPCLMERLQDHEPDRKTDAFVQVSTIEDVKEDVLHNLEMILNSRSHIPEEDLPEDLRDSVLNYGMFDFSGRIRGGQIIRQIQDAILQRIRYFEPRIDSESLKVELLENAEEMYNVVTFRITGYILVKPLEAEFLVISRINLDSGFTVLKSGGNNIGV